MKNELAMALFSRRALTDSVAREQITALSNFGGGIMRPDKCSDAEPIRKAFDPAEINEPVRWLARPQGAFFYNKGSPVHLSGEIWNLARSPAARFPAGPFTNYWTARFNIETVRVEKVEDFAREMFRVTASDFGLLTTQADLKAKNTVATSYSYKGMSLESGVPGLYWMNFLSDELARWLGLNTLPKELAAINSITGGGVSLKFCESHEQCGSFEALQRQHAAIEWLGPEKFFAIDLPDRKAETPDWSKMPLRSPQ